MLIKICGITSAEAMLAAAGADMVGFVFYAASPRAVSAAQAQALSAVVPAGPQRVGLFVDAMDDAIAAVLAVAKLDMLQLHGAEPPARCAALRARFGLPVMKALGIAIAADLGAVAHYAPVVDRLLLDAKPAPDAARPGGNAARFDWSLTAGLAIPVPWLLAGGLTPGNVAMAIATSGTSGVDVSSGVESVRGVKDAGLIHDFIAQARGA